MTIALDGANGTYLRHDYAAPAGYQKTLGGFFKINSGSSGFAITSTKTDTAGATIAGWIDDAGGHLYNYRQTSSGGSSDDLGTTEAHRYALALEYLMITAIDDSTFTMFTPLTPTGRTFNPAGDVPAEIAALASFVLGCFFRNGSRTFSYAGAMAECGEWRGGTMGATEYAALAAGTPGETVNAANCYDVWDLDIARASYTGKKNGNILTAFGTGITTSGITHPVTRSGGGGSKSGINFFRRNRPMLF